MAEENKNENYIETPVHEESYRYLLMSLPKRFIGLISKAIGVKMLLMAVATWLFLTMPEHFPWYAWVLVYSLTIFGKEGFKLIDKIKK